MNTLFQGCTADDYIKKTFGTEAEAIDGGKKKSDEWWKDAPLGKDSKREAYNA